MARRAIHLITRCRAEPVEICHHGARRTGRIDRLPVVDPLSLDRAVLYRKYVNLARGESRGIGLLPFRPDSVINRVNAPVAGWVPNGEVVFIAPDGHSRP